jgi:hypothetical protein
MNELVAWVSWEFLVFVGAVAGGLGLITALCALFIGLYTRRVRRPVAGVFVATCGALAIAGGSMLIGRVIPPDDPWGTITSPCHSVDASERAHDRCLKRHYDYTNNGLSGIAVGVGLVAGGIWMLRTPTGERSPDGAPSNTASA